MDEDTKFGVVVSLCVLAVVVAIAVVVLQPFFEARAFNKFTSGRRATYWDACWTELRVMPK